MKVAGGFNSVNYKNFLDFNKKLEESKEKSLFTKKTKKSDESSIMGNMMKEKKILAKVARGEKLSSKEREALKEIEPSKVQQAQAASRERERVERELKTAKNQEEQEKILMSAKSMAVSASSTDIEYSELLMEAINKAESNHKEGKTDKDEVGRSFDRSI